MEAELDLSERWIDNQGDIWRLGEDGLMHTFETAPFSREYVEKKWGPLRRGGGGGDGVTDLSVKFLEPQPKVGGLTGEQLSLLRLLEDEDRCDFEDELNRRCPDTKRWGSQFCGFHERIEDESTYDAYDSYRDRSYE